MEGVLYNSTQATPRVVVTPAARTEVLERPRSPVQPVARTELERLRSDADRSRTSPQPSRRVDRLEINDDPRLLRLSQAAVQSAIRRSLDSFVESGRAADLAASLSTPASTTDTLEAPPPDRISTEPNDGLTREERRLVDELRRRDTAVRRHEEAHKAAAGELFRGGPYYEFETGPDGNRYAVAGSVQIDTSAGSTPEETLQRAAKIRRAALAPADPSSTDKAIAAKATRMESDARREMAADRTADVQADLEAKTEIQGAEDDAEVAPDTNPSPDNTSILTEDPGESRTRAGEAGVDLLA